MVETLAEALPKQIKRVSEKKERWVGYMRDTPELGGPGMQLSINIMQAEIDCAIEALASGDVVRMMQCHESLAGYNDDD